MNFSKLSIVVIALFMAGVIACSAQKQEINTLTSKEKKQGYKLLFDGHDLNGWHSYLKDQLGNAWSVKNGTIALDHSNGVGGGDLTTDNEYQNFDLKLEWKISPGGNSGVIFDVHESPKFKQTWFTGPEMQILDNKGWPTHLNPNQLSGSLYDMIAADRSATKSTGRWNKVRIRKNKGLLQFWLNGTKVVDTQMWNNHWKELINNSKFKNRKGFASYKKGHIALQDHGHTKWVKFRNIKIKEL